MNCIGILKILIISLKEKKLTYLLNCYNNIIKMKCINFIINIKQNFKQKYYITNWNGDIIKDNLSLKQAKKYCKKNNLKKLYIQKELTFF